MSLDNAAEIINPLDDDGLPMQCKECRFYTGTIVTGHCRFDPPAVVLLGMRQNPIVGGAPIPVTTSQWPAVDGDRWCGKFKREDDKHLIDLMPAAPIIIEAGNA